MSTINLSKRLEAMEQRTCFLEQTVSTNVLDVKVSDNSGDQRHDPPVDLSSADMSDNANDDETDSKLPYVEVVRKKRQTEKVHKTGHRQPLASTSQPAVSRNQPHQHKKSQKVLGNRDDKDTVLKAGVKIIPKSVVHIDNLSPECTEALLKDYLLSANIPVLSCYTSKSWLREGEKDQATAFRVCVPREHRHLLFEPQLWSQGVIIRDWKFKGPQHGGHA